MITEARVVAKLIFATFFVWNTSRGLAQTTSTADSLKLVWLSEKTLPDSIKMVTLDKIMQASSSPIDKLLFANQLIGLAEPLHATYYVLNAYKSKGLAYQTQGDLFKSLENFTISARLSHEYGYPNMEAAAYREIAAIYQSVNQIQQALEYQLKAIAVLRTEPNSEPLAWSLLEAGTHYEALNQLDSALLFYSEAEALFDALNRPTEKAFATGHQALVHRKQNDSTRAEQELRKSIEVLTHLGDSQKIIAFQNELGRIYIEYNKLPEALVCIQKALAMAQTSKQHDQIAVAFNLLASVYARQNQYSEAYNYMQQYQHHHDSLQRDNYTKELSGIQITQAWELKKKEQELLDKQQTIVQAQIILAVLVLTLIILLPLYTTQRLRAKHEAKLRLKKEHIATMLKTEETKALESIIEGREHERQELAHELHSQFGSLLATIKANLNGLSAADTPKYQTIITLIDRACTDVRHMSQILYKGTAEFGLKSALYKLFQQVESSYKLKIDFYPTLGETPLEAKTEIFVYQIVLELVHQLLQNTTATRASLILTCFRDENLMNILMEDNRTGTSDASENDKNPNHELNHLKQLIALHQGEFQIDNPEGQGATTNIDLPIPADRNPF